MKFLFLWPVAFLIAGCWLLGSHARPRQPRILQGKLSPRLLRMVVLAMVMLGAGKRTEAQTQPARVPPRLFDGERVIPLTVEGKHVVLDDHDVPRSTEFPAPLTEEAAKKWALLCTSPYLLNGNMELTLAQLGRTGSGAHPDDKPTPWQQIAAAKAAKTILPPDALMKAADQLASSGFYFQPAIADIWQCTGPVKSADVDALSGLYSRLEDCVRADNALIFATAQTGPVTTTGWMSKAGQSAVRAIIPPSFVDTAKKLFPTTDAGLWETEGVLSFRLPDAKDAPSFTLIRRNQKVPLKPGEFVQLRRLDILVIGPASAANAPTFQAAHRTLGNLNLPYDTVITARDAAQLLTPDAQKKIDTMTADALDGDPDAVHLLEMILPVAVPTLRPQTTATARGAPAIRMLLQEFDGQ